MSDLIPGMHLPEFLARRDQVLGGYQRAFEALLDANEQAKQAGLDDFSTLEGYSAGEGRLWERVCQALGAVNRRYSKEAEPEPLQILMERITPAVDAACWTQLMTLSGLWSFIDSKRRVEWNEAIRLGAGLRDTGKATAPPPTLTAENVAATFQSIHAERGQMLNEGLLALFRGLSWDYKSNLPVCLAPKLILKGHFEAQDRFSTSWYPDIRSSNQLDDLIRALCQADGKPEPDSRSGSRRFAGAQDMTGAPWEPYFELRRFKNGNAHVIFHKHAMGLVDKLNARISELMPGALPAPR
ncbi:TPA: DUF4942 domain-containing protein [Stenotrophomonas maltophilia]|uniref:DUF4942 domain-containing protein n=1 Tax=Stenotrophomonas TaxID=40323 RepID=UPI001311E99A|nr:MULTISPECIES: DUF4942 domain-containing protein [Stenotrophomonas]EKT2104471.1 DUF4942 domain-containing protein [Stenotrophomonas maltophilia]ELC7321866.1 DUF4942 domain-containing protein [Stenotrophomonas maltophilia]MBH1731960.1 DUF4942 domain-containing protein [Stenotrophomonas maltophilia]UXB41362.1 DUF4942 domain-containing protein [Stenotrophomonas maltophilia]HEL3245709.1 DUF4942 domain-containing protein [Stenotrophomonas maltophilia]